MFEEINIKNLELRITSAKSRLSRGSGDDTMKIYSDKQIEGLLEKALKHTDLNDDGYIDYHEYRINDEHALKETIYKDEDLMKAIDDTLKMVRILCIKRVIQ
ncbi:unnamed protein product [Leptidea sinapis]|uniref:EF-hand domain-containing protein n=1 Tax=Leptidea sinapis TaxID=189913 RepID=A0A5E4QND9_9NEOP|nr:unnamed protein product [Leptidea sinapis]